MIVEYTRYLLSEHSPEDLISAYGRAAPQLQAAPECLAYELVQCEEEPAVFVLRIEWASPEAHLQGFRSGPHFPPFLEEVRPFIGEIAEMRHYRSPALEWRR